MGILNKKGGGSGEKVDTGVYIEKVKITGVEDKSGTEIFPGSPPPDLALELTYKAGAGEFKQTLMGNFKSENGAIVGLGGAFVIDLLLQELDFYSDKEQEEVDDLEAIIMKGAIPKEIKNFLIGKEVYRISYVKGIRDDDPSKLSYGSWNRLYADKEKMIKEWHKSIGEGYPKNYDPDAVHQLDDKNSSFNPEDYEDENVEEETPI